MCQGVRDGRGLSLAIYATGTLFKVYAKDSVIKLKSDEGIYVVV